MSQHDFALEPRTSTVAGMSVLAQVTADKSKDSWDVTIVFSRAVGLPPMQAEEVDAQLIDTRGKAKPVVERPSGPLVEFGGSLGNSVNASFRFHDSRLEPGELVVTCRGETARFRVVSGGGSEGGQVKP